MNISLGNVETKPHRGILDTWKRFLEEFNILHVRTFYSFLYFKIQLTTPVTWNLKNSK